jgi:WD40 repeat protein
VSVLLLTGVLGVALGTHGSSPSPVPEPPAEPGPRVDQYGDPLPPGAVLRLGSDRFRHGGRVNALAHSPDGETIASAGGGRIILWEASTGKHLRTLIHPDTDEVFGLAFSPDGGRLASVGSRKGDGAAGQVLSWDSETGNAADVSDPPAVMRSAAFSPDGGTLAAGGDDGHLFLIDARELRTRREVKIEDWAVQGLSFSPDGRRLAAAAEYDVIIYDAAGDEQRRLDIGRPVGHAVFSPDGASVWVGKAGGVAWRIHDPGTVTHWDIETGARLGSWPAHEGSALALAVSPDGRTLASGGSENGPWLWDAATGEKRELDVGPDGFRPWAQDLSFSPDGKTLALADADGRIRIWDVETRQELFADNGHRGGVASAVFSPDETRIATAGDDGTVRRSDGS